MQRSRGDYTSICSSPYWIALAALLIRVAWIFIAHTYRFKIDAGNFGFGFEMGRIGNSLALGHGFSSPFDGNTGSTAWEPPVYPFLIAGVFKLLGVYSRASAIALLSLSSLFSALTCIPTYLIARRCFDRRIACWSAWAWAVLPPIIFWCTRWVWETSLTALILAALFWLTLFLQEAGNPGPWLGWGVLWGVAALTNPSLLAFLPASGLWVWNRRAKMAKRSLAGVAASAMIFLACIAPWIARNQRAMGSLIFIRSNFGAELRYGNGPGATGVWMGDLHPSKSPEQLQRYRELGELNYVAECKREAMDFIRQDYGRFVRLDIKRFVYFWAGLPHPDKTLTQSLLKNAWAFGTSLLAFWGLWKAFRNGTPAASLFLWLIVFFPAIYCITFPSPRYRHPIEPELAILVVYALAKSPPADREFSRN